MLGSAEARATVSGTWTVRNLDNGVANIKHGTDRHDHQTPKDHPPSLISTLSRLIWMAHYIHGSLLYTTSVSSLTARTGIDVSSSQEAWYHGLTRRYVFVLSSRMVLTLTCLGQLGIHSHQICFARFYENGTQVELGTRYSNQLRCAMLDQECHSNCRV